MSGQASKVEDPERVALRKQGGAWLKQCRERTGLSQRDFAEKVGVGYYTFISQIESGRGRIPPERYQDWASALEMNPRDFFRQLLAFYEPITYAIIFEQSAA